jgi:hypothetical protein
MRSRTMIVLPICLALGLAGFSGACKKGTAEKAGEKIDDALEGKGPAQRTEKGNGPSAPPLLFFA